MERYEQRKPNINEIREALYGEETAPDWDRWILDNAGIIQIQAVKREQRIKYFLDCPDLFREDY